MSTIQIHELAGAGRLSAEDRIVVSTAIGRLTRQAGLSEIPVTAHSQGVERTLSDRARDFVSIRDFGAVGDGVADDAPVFQAAVDAHAAIFVPPGTYRLGSRVEVPPRRALIGAGRDVTIIRSEGAHAFAFRRNAGLFEVDGDATDDWNRSTLSSISIDMAFGGILAEGHEFFVERVRLRGGQPSAWAIELVDANECSLREIAAGTGGGAHDLYANGVWIRASKAANYGDSLVEEVSIKLKGAGTTGFRVEHEDPAYVMNNILFSRAQVNSAGVPTASTGIHLKRVMRSAFVNVDVEFVETAFRVEGTAGGGGSGSCRHLNFVSSYVLNCTTPWVDSNASLPGSVMRCLFTGCQGFGPLSPLGIGSSDVAAKAGEGDTFLPAGLWLAEPALGTPATQIRSADAGRLLIASEHFDGASTARDGNPKNPQPRRGLGVDITSDDASRLYRPRGYAPGQESRLVLGNGEDFPVSGGTAAPLHRIEVADPLMLSPRRSAPPAPRDGMVIYADEPNVLSGAAWSGPGWYTRLAGNWHPGTNLPGRVAERERNLNFALEPSDFGKIHRINNGNAVTVTVRSTYPSGSGSAPLLEPAGPGAMLWLVRQGFGEVTIAAGDANVKVLSPDGDDQSVKIKRRYQLIALMLRHNAATGALEVFTNARPDGELTYEQTLGWTSASGTDNTEASPYTVLSNRAGQLLRFSSSASTAYVAFGPESMPQGTTSVRFRLVSLQVPMRIIAQPGTTPQASLKRVSGTTAGGTDYFEVDEPGRVVTVHMTGASDPQQPYALYIEG